MEFSGYNYHSAHKAKQWTVTGVLVLEELVLGLKFPTEILGHRTISTRKNSPIYPGNFGPVLTGPGRTISGNKIIVKKGSGTIFGCRLILRSRNALAIYELPSSNEDQMEFRYKHLCYLEFRYKHLCYQ